MPVPAEFRYGQLDLLSRYGHPVSAFWPISKCGQSEEGVVVVDAFSESGSAAMVISKAVAALDQAARLAQQ